MNKLTKPSPAFVRFRESHHAVARMFAMGHTISKVSRDTGYTRRRLHILLQDPSFQELIAEYAKTLKDKIDEAQDQFAEMAVSDLIRAEAQIQEHLDIAEENGELLPMRELLAIVKDRADRFGYSAKRVIQHDHSFATKLDKAIEASNKAKVIEHQPASSEPPVLSRPSPKLVDARQIEPMKVGGPSDDLLTNPSEAPARPLGTGFPKKVAPSFARVLRREVRVA